MFFLPFQNFKFYLIIFPIISDIYTLEISAWRVKLTYQLTRRKTIWTFSSVSARNLALPTLSKLTCATSWRPATWPTRSSSSHPAKISPTPPSQLEKRSAPLVEDPIPLIHLHHLLDLLLIMASFHG